MFCDSCVVTVEADGSVTHEPNCQTRRLERLEREKTELLAALKKITEGIGVIFVGLQLDRLDRNFALQEIKKLVREAEITRAAIQHAEDPNG